MYKYNVVLVIMVWAIFISGCVTQSALPTVISTRESFPTTAVPITASTTPSLQSQKEEILRQIKAEALSYSSYIEDEKSKGNYETIDLGQGKKGLEFTGDALDKVSAKHKELWSNIDHLNQQYWELFQMTPTPVPTLPDKANGQAVLDKLMADYQTWLFNELQHGTTITIYNPDAMEYLPELIGDSYAENKAKGAEIDKLRLWLRAPSADSIQQDIQMIKSIEPGDIVLKDIGVFPYYRMDINLTTYETNDRFYILYTKVHQIIEINVKNFPKTAASTPSLSLNQQELEQEARRFVAMFSPGVNLDNLTTAGGSKIGSFFFRWEDRTKPPLDDGRSYPFVQVGLNGDGELLNYYNTLPLAR